VRPEEKVDRKGGEGGGGGSFVRLFIPNFYKCRAGGKEKEGKGEEELSSVDRNPSRFHAAPVRFTWGRSSQEEKKKGGRGEPSTQPVYHLHHLHPLYLFLNILKEREGGMINREEGEGEIKKSLSTFL